MVQVRITGWRYGLKKVSMTTTIRDALDLGLADAKRCTDRVLDGEVVVLDVPSREAAIALAGALHELGADVEVADGGETGTPHLPHPPERR